MANISVRIPDEVQELIRDRAKRDRRSVNNEIVWLIEQALRSHGSCPGRMEGVSRFEVIDHTGQAQDTARLVVRYGVNVDLALQDEGTTLKVFLTAP